MSREAIIVNNVFRAVTVFLEALENGDKEGDQKQLSMDEVKDEVMKMSESDLIRALSMLYVFYEMRTDGLYENEYIC